MSDNTTLLNLDAIEQALDDYERRRSFVPYYEPESSPILQEHVSTEEVRALVATVRGLNGYVADADRIIAVYRATLDAVKAAVDENRWTDAKKLLEDKD